MLPAKLARLICLLLLQKGWRCGGHWNDDFRVCRNNVIHEFTTFFSHKQQFNDDDKSCKLEAEKLSSLWWYGGSSLWWNFCQRQFLVGLALQTTTAAPAHHLFETNNESNWLCQVPNVVWICWYYHWLALAGFLLCQKFQLLFFVVMNVGFSFIFCAVVDLKLTFNFLNFLRNNCFYSQTF